MEHSLYWEQKKYLASLKVDGLNKLILQYKQNSNVDFIIVVMEQPCLLIFFFLGLVILHICKDKYIHKLKHFTWKIDISLIFILWFLITFCTEDKNMILADIKTVITSWHMLKPCIKNHTVVIQLRYFQIYWPYNFDQHQQSSNQPASVTEDFISTQACAPHCAPSYL